MLCWASGWPSRRRARRPRRAAFGASPSPGEGGSASRQLAGMRPARPHRAQEEGGTRGSPSSCESPPPPSGRASRVKVGDAFRLPPNRPGHSNRAAIGMRHLPLRAQRALKGMGLIGKKGKTAGVPLLVSLPRAAALPAHLGSGYPPGAPCAPLRGGAPSRGPGQPLLPLRGNSPSRALQCRRRRIIRAAYNIINRSIVKIG